MTEESKKALQSDEWQTVRNIIKSEAVKEYLATSYADTEKQCEITANNVKYKVLRRDKKTTFYDENGNTLFDVDNEILAAEYEKLSENQTEPETPMGKTIADIERQAFEQVAENDTDKKEDNEDIASEDCDSPVEETQIKEDGKSEEKIQNSSVYIGVVGAVTKLQEELKKAKEKDFAKPVIEHLIERCKDSESFSSDVCQNHKTWEKCFKYIYEQARKQIKGSSGAVRDDVVYEWAEDYYHKDDKAEEEKKAKKEAKAKAKREKAAAERKTQAKEKPSSVAAPAISKKEDKRKDQVKKNSKDMEGQLDMFSMMGM